MINKNGAFIFLNEGNGIDLFLYKRCSIIELKEKLSIGFSDLEIQKDHNCLVIFFQNELKYLGSGKIEDIPNLVKKKNMFNFIGQSLENCQLNGFSKLDKKIYENFKEFCKLQLNF